MRGNSPCEAWRTNCRSDDSVRVGRPVLGPPRATSAITRGVSVIAARPYASTIKTESTTRARGHRPHTGVRRADREQDRCKLVLSLLLDDAKLACIRGDVFRDRAGRSHRVGRDELAARRDRAHTDSLIAVDEHLLGLIRNCLELPREVSAVLVTGHVVCSFGNLHVAADDVSAFALEVVLDDVFDTLEVVLRRGRPSRPARRYSS